MLKVNIWIHKPWHRTGAHTLYQPASKAYTVYELRHVRRIAMQDASECKPGLHLCSSVKGKEKKDHLFPDFLIVFAECIRYIHYCWQIEFAIFLSTPLSSCCHLLPCLPSNPLTHRHSDTHADSEISWDDIASASWIPNFGPHTLSFNCYRLLNHETRNEGPDGFLPGSTFIH